MRGAVAGPAGRGVKARGPGWRGAACRGHRVVKAFGMESFEEARFREATRRHLRANLRGQMLSNLSGPVIESLGVIGAGVFLVFAGRAIHSQTMEPGVLVKFLIGLYAM